MNLERLLLDGSSECKRRHGLVNYIYQIFVQYKGMYGTS